MPIEMRVHTKFLKKIAVVLLVGGQVYSCSSPPKVEPIDLQAQVQKDNALGDQLAIKIQDDVRYRQSRRIQSFLHGLTLRMMSHLEVHGRSKLDIKILDDLEQWRSFSLPGIHLYLSKNILKRLQFENEVAAVVALELAHIELRSPVMQAERMVANKTITPAILREKIFNYSDEMIYQAMELAVRLMYDSSYDPRGMVTLWEIYRKNPRHSPYTEKQIKNFISRAREAVVEFSPLRSPIIRSESFMLLEKEFNRL